jgi:hypothetical protein
VRFDRWVQRGPFTAVDLGLYRIIYAVATLLTVSDVEWVGNYPDSVINAPAGPFALLPGIPAAAVLVALEVLRSVALALLAVGLWTRWASLAVAMLLLITYGLSYSLGKVDHTILVVLTPLILSFADWGRRVSVDALLHDRDAESQSQWPLRYLALMVGLAFFAAAWLKLTTGWLSASTQAALGHSLVRFYSYDTTSWSVQWVAGTHQSRFMWEAVDWLTVLFEFAILLTVPWWRAFRIALAAAVLFHLGVYIAMGIDFSFNVVVYGAFVSWSVQLRRFRPFEYIRGRPPVVIFALAAVVIGGAIWFVTSTTPTVGAVCGVAIVLAGAAMAIGYLLREVTRVSRRAVRF